MLGIDRLMNSKQIQKGLNGLGAKLEVDGLLGRKTWHAIDETLASHVPGAVLEDWTDGRKIVAVEQVIMLREGIEAGVVDGLVGPQTLYAREVFVGRLTGSDLVENWRDDLHVSAKETEIEASAVWPKYDSMLEFFGAPGKNHTYAEMPFPMKIAWDLSKNLKHFTCNEKIQKPLERIFQKTLDHYGLEEIVQLRLDRFGGCYSNRKMRGGKKLSTHACAAAVDIDPERNQLKWGNKLALLDDPAYDKFWSFVEAEGGVSLGRQRNYDWMHFQFVRL